MLIQFARRVYIAARYAPSARNAPANAPIAPRCANDRRGSRAISLSTMIAPAAHADVPKTRQLRQSSWRPVEDSPVASRALAFGAYVRCENGVDGLVVVDAPDADARSGDIARGRVRDAIT